MNPPPSDPIDLAILLFNNLQNRNVADGQLSGVVESNIDFDRIHDSLETAGLLINANPSSRQIECHLPSGFFESLKALLDVPAYRIKPLARFYLANINFLHDGHESVVPPIISQYFQATQLYSLLEKIADHHGGVGAAKTLVFLNKSKIEIIPKYDEDDLSELDTLQAFGDNFFLSDTHKEQKQIILKTVLLELFSGRSKVNFSELLKRFAEFAEKVRAGYELYVAEFSFQKVKEEVEKEKLDAMVKLNKVFSDIQSQLLTIPAALLVVGTQMENNGQISLKNLLIWFASLIFTVLMDLLIRNQRHTLKAVKQEIDQQRQQIEFKYQTIAPRFAHIYKEIDGRHKHQRRLIRTVEILIGLFWIITTFVLLFYANALPGILDGLHTLHDH
jgi:hypothetical protein